MKVSKLICMIVVIVILGGMIWTVPAGAFSDSESGAADLPTAVDSLQPVATQVLADGTRIEAFGQGCLDRIFRVAVPSTVSDPGAGVRFTLDDNCLPTQVGIGTPASAPADATPSSASNKASGSGNASGPALIGLSESTSVLTSTGHNYHHAYSQIIEAVGALTAEFETVNGRWWDGTWAWWYDPACCEGWAYALAVTYLPNWSPSTPEILYVEENTCRSTGSCTSIRSDFRERFTTTFFWCFGDNRHPTVEHGHRDFNAGQYFTFYYYSNLCPGLTTYSSNWLSDGQWEEVAG